MSTKKNYRISKEIRDEILKKIKDEGVTVSQAAENYGVATQTLRKGIITIGLNWT